MNPLVPSKAPNLRVPSSQYDQQYFDTLTNQLRLYFNQVDNANAALIRTASSTSVLNWLGEGSF